MSPVVSRNDYLQMMQHQQQLRTIIKFEGAAAKSAGEGRQQQQQNQNSGNHGTDSGKHQRYSNGKKGGSASWKSQNNHEDKGQTLNNTNNGSRQPFWDLNTTPAHNHQQHHHQLANSKTGITSPTSSQCSKDSLSSIWFTPPQSHSPASSTSVGDLMMGPMPTSSSTPLKREPKQPQVGRMIRAQDLSSGREANIWSTPPPQLPLVGVSTPAAARYQAPPLSSNCSVSASTTGRVFGGAKTSNAACLQLFSDNFMSYLNMIN